MRRRARIGLLAAVAVLVSSCSVSVSPKTPPSSSTSTSTTRAPTKPPALGAKLSWSPCHSGFRCATLVVPASYSNASKGTFDISVIEAQATTNPATAPDIVMNPGGPGEGGISFLTSSVSAFSALRSHFNLVSFDPRGSGSSEPVRCTNAAGLERFLSLNPSPSTAAQVSAVVSGVKAFVRSCVQNTPARVLQNVTTADSARDMDRLRAALGQAKLDYLGFSYGTYLGSLYAEMFPAHAGRLVLDGAVDPGLPATQELGQQAAGFETDLNQFFTWCDKTPSCSSTFPSGTKAAFDSLMRRLESGATLTADMSAAYGGAHPVNYGLALLGAVSALYSQATWKYLGQAIAQAANGEGALFLALAYSYAGIGPNGTAQNILEANIAINCVDRAWPSTVSQIKSIVGSLTAQAPDFGPSEAWGNLPCAYWPVKASADFGAIHLARPLPILVVGSTSDPATPYRWAQSLTSQLTGSRLLTRRGPGHTGYLASQCVRTWVNRYLETAALPPLNTICAS